MKGERKMPTQTFFNLPIDKQKRLLDAASTEFSRVPLTEASINNIIKLAEISRGSFYQYFKDKEDLYYYFFATLKQDSKKMLEDCLKEADGDLFLGYQNYFPKMLTMITEDKQASFFKHMFLHMDYRTSREVTPEAMKKRECQHKKDRHHNHFADFVNADLLKIDSDEDFHSLIKVMMTFLFQTIGDAFAKELPRDEVIASFNKKLFWLRDGVYVKSEGEQ